MAKSVLVVKVKMKFLCFQHQMMKLPSSTQIFLLQLVQTWYEAAVMTLQQKSTIVTRFSWALFATAILKRGYKTKKDWTFLWNWLKSYRRQNVFHWKNSWTRRYSAANVSQFPIVMLERRLHQRSGTRAWKRENLSRAIDQMGADWNRHWKDFCARLGGGGEAGERCLEKIEFPSPGRVLERILVQTEAPILRCEAVKLRDVWEPIWCYPCVHSGMSIPRVFQGYTVLDLWSGS